LSEFEQQQTFQLVDDGSFQERLRPKRGDGADPGASAHNQSWTRRPLQKENKIKKRNAINKTFQK
jgi:hypothetical protein